MSLKRYSAGPKRGGETRRETDERETERSRVKESEGDKENRRILLSVILDKVTRLQPLVLGSVEKDD